MKKYILALALGLSATAVSAAPVTFNIALDAGTQTGSGTIVIDDSLIAPNAYVPTVQSTVSISFAGYVFDTTYYAPSENWVFDGAGYNIASLIDTLGSYVDFSVGGSSPYLSFIEGSAPGAFTTYALPGGDLSGTYSISRAGSVSAVPLPAGGVLLVTALLGGAAAGRRRKKRAA